MARKIFSAIDMGTNSFHMIIVEIKKDGSFKYLDKEREVVRLAAGSEGSLGEISEEDIQKTIYLLNNFKQLADYYHSMPRAVATSAIREARNKAYFIERVKAETGVSIEVIDGKHEAGLIYLGMNMALSLRNKNAVSFDIGGGSTEIIYSQSGEIKFVESLKLGAVRLSKMFFPNHILTEKNISECRSYIENIFNKHPIPYQDMKYDTAVGASGTIQSVAFIISSLNKKKPPKSMNNFVITADDFQMVLNEVLNKKTTDERLSIRGMEAKRADILPAGLLILEYIFKVFGINELGISEFALREGIIIDSFNNYLKSKS